MSRKQGAEQWSAERKLQMIEQYDGLAEEEAQGRFLREHGLYSVEIERWREEMLQALAAKPRRNDANQRRIKELERELRRKEKALAETAALLALKKRAQQIWGDDEDAK